MTTRQLWSSRAAFLFAAIGAAVGFGNVWRFPALAYSYGGGAFFIPYVMALIFVGIPMLVLEVATGQHLRTGDVGVFGSINERLRGVGLASVLCGFMVTGYYVPLIAWVLRALLESFGHMSDDWEDITGTEATSYFYNSVIGMSTIDEDLSPTRVVGKNVFYLLFTWAGIGVCLMFGIKWTGRIAYITMGLPIILLAVFGVRAATLPGASNGIKAYIGDWDLSVLRERPDCWSTAVTQIFFSLGVTFGIMTAFGSHCPRNAPALENSIIIALANSFFSFFSGFSVFGVLGYLQQYENAEHISEVVKSGPALLFGAYPAALSTVPGGLHWVRFLFFNLILLGIDSAFALTEAVVTVIKDSTLGSVFSHKAIVGAVTSFGFFCGIMYTTDSGLYFLDVVDFYVNFIVLLIGFCKTFAAGWIYGLEGQLERLGPKVVYSYMVTTYGSILIASIVWFGSDQETIGGGILTFLIFYSIGATFTWRWLKEQVENHCQEDLTVHSALYDLLLGNVLELRFEIEKSTGNITMAWAVLIKHFIPPLLLVLFFNLACAQNDEGKSEFGHYQGYAFWPFQAIGIVVICIIAIVFLVGFARPDLYERLAARSEEEEKGKEEDDGNESDEWTKVEAGEENEMTGYVELPDKNPVHT